jgi:hypothetical protein
MGDVEEELVDVGIAEVLQPGNPRFFFSRAYRHSFSASCGCRIVHEGSASLRHDDVIVVLSMAPAAAPTIRLQAALQTVI